MPVGPSGGTPVTTTTPVGNRLSTLRKSEPSAALRSPGLRRCGITHSPTERRERELEPWLSACPILTLSHLLSFRHWIGNDFRAAREVRALPHDAGRLLNWVAAHSVQGLALTPVNSWPIRAEADQSGRRRMARCPSEVRRGIGWTRCTRAAVGVGGQSRPVAVAGRLGSRPPATTGPRRPGCRNVAQNAYRWYCAM
jgi:hypothetical protein